QPARVGKSNPEPSGTGGGIEHRIDEIHLAAEALSRKSDETDLRGLAWPDEAQILLGDIRHHPDTGEVGDPEQGGSGLEAHPFDRHLLGKDAGSRRAD